MTAAGQRGEAERQRFLARLRATGLLPLAERVAFRREARARREENAAFSARNAGLDMPPLRWMHDMYAHASYALYWRSGEADAGVIASLVERHLGEGRHRVAEWGCGMGRITRHLERRYEVHGFDYNRHAVAWCEAHLAGTYRRNALMPPLPTGAASLDAVFAVSVLTHLSARAHEAWAAELGRALRPGGIALVTVHGAPGPEQLLPAERAAFDAGELVTRGRVREGSRIYTAFQPEAYMRRLLARASLDVAAEPVPAFGQTLWVARRR